MIPIGIMHRSFEMAKVKCRDKEWFVINQGLANEGVKVTKQTTKEMPIDDINVCFDHVMAKLAKFGVFKGS